MVDEIFDKLHDQGRMSWSGFILFSYPVFVVWKIVQDKDRQTIRKGRIIMDIRRLNKIILADVYFLPF